jgi:hypothetical protein
MAAVRTAALATLELRQRDPEVCLAALVLLVEGIDAGWPESPPEMPFPPQISDAATIDSAAAGPPPATPTLPEHSR